MKLQLWCDSVFIARPNHLRKKMRSYSTITLFPLPFLGKDRKKHVRMRQVFRDLYITDVTMPAEDLLARAALQQPILFESDQQPGQYG